MNVRLKLMLWGMLAAGVVGTGLYTVKVTGNDGADRQGGTPPELPSSHVVGPDAEETAANASLPDAVHHDAGSARTSVSNVGAADRQDSRQNLHLEGFLAFNRIPTELIQTLVLESDAGNPQARYSLAKLLHICESMLERFPDDSALVEFMVETDRARQPEFVAAVEREAGACLDLQEFYGGRERSAQQWMQMAAEQGYGPALAALAGAWIWDSPLSSGESAAEIVEQEERRRVLVAAAVKTLNPEALFAVSGFFGAMGPMSKGQPGESLAWNMAACHFGLDCGPDNWFLQWLCRYGGDCGETYANGLIAYLEYNQYSPSAVDYAVRRAPELIAILEAGDWDALGITWPEDPGLHEVLAEIAKSGAEPRPGNQ